MFSMLGLAIIEVSYHSVGPAVCQFLLTQIIFISSAKSHVLVDDIILMLSRMI